MRALASLAAGLLLLAAALGADAAGARAPRALPKASQAVKGAGPAAKTPASKVQVVDGGTIKARRRVPAVTVDIARVPFRPSLSEPRLRVPAAGTPPSGDRRAASSGAGNPRSGPDAAK